ncbi:MAG: hypothetical protein ACYCTB_09735 [bacterium]
MIDEYKLFSYIKERADELKNYSKDGSAFFFLMASAYIDFLSCAINNQCSSGIKYCEFIQTYFGKVNPVYKQAGVALAIYCVMRNGLLHNFSFAPEHRGVCRGNNITIKVFHVKNNDSEKDHMKMPNNKLLLIGAEPFACDIQKTVKKILISSDIKLKSNILKWCENHPPIAPIGYFNK